MPTPLIPPSPHELAELAAMWRAFNAASYSVVPKPKSVSRRIHRRLSAEAIDQLVERYQAGESTPKLSEKFGIAASSVCMLLRQEGVTLRRKAMSRESIEQADTARASQSDKYLSELATPMEQSEQYCIAMVH